MADQDHKKKHMALRLKEWKRRLRRWKRRLWSISIAVIVCGALGFGISIMEDARRSAADTNRPQEHVQETFMRLHQVDKEPSPATQLVMKQLSQGSDKYTVIHRLQYICGKQDQSLGRKTASAIISLVLDNPDWEASMDKEGRVILEQQVSEMSETCKRSAHMGIDEVGNLNLYDGKPEEDHVIRTFFQLDVEYMKSALPPRMLKQLHSGIPITDIADYESVMSTLSDYAVEDTSKVMKPMP